MTAKEKVLASNPGAVVCTQGGDVWIADSYNEWKKLSAVIGATEAAWQNAAESLPAQPEPDPKCQCTHLYPEHWPARSGNAGGCFRCHCSGFFVAEPVAPVEAKEEKWLKCPYCGRLSEGGKYHEQQCEAPVKPQPDSSSIPDETDPCKMTDAQYEEYIYGPNRAEWPTNQTAAPPDSSSISTEQTFGDWWNKQGRLFMAGDDIHVQRVVMGVCERAWAAAKGQSNGR